MAKEIREFMLLKSGRDVNVRVCKIDGDGNCLFHAFSLGLTGTQMYDSKIREAITLHMLKPEYRSYGQDMFAGENENQIQSYADHVERMMKGGVWGTEQEIMAAANYFQISMLCFSKYNGSWLIQHFSPHCASIQDCFEDCNHKSMFLVNASGQHYELVIVNKVTALR